MSRKDRIISRLLQFVTSAAKSFAGFESELETLRAENSALKRMVATLQTQLEEKESHD